MWFLLIMFPLPLGAWDGLRYFIVTIPDVHIIIMLRINGYADSTNTDSNEPLENLSFGYSTRLESNRTAQPQMMMIRQLLFRLAKAGFLMMLLNWQETIIAYSLKFRS